MQKVQVLIFTGNEEGERWNTDRCIRAKVDPSVTIIPEGLFSCNSQLQEVELCEGLLMVSEGAFFQCPNLSTITIPSTVISIGHEVFAHTQITNLRIPPLVTIIPSKIAHKAKCLFSVELSENIAELDDRAFMDSTSLRNIALPPDCEIGYCAFFCCPQLRLLCDIQEWDDNEAMASVIVSALKSRFDGLPIHKIIYYQSYNGLTAEQLELACMGSGEDDKLDASGEEIDTLGMTPLHILACSTVQNLELYQVLVEKHPQNLITEDKWGAVPILYTVWGNVSDEIVQFLVESYKTIHPDYKFDWTMMIETLGSACVPLDTLQRLVYIQQDCFPTQGIDWSSIMQNAASVPFAENNYRQTELQAFKSLLKCKIANRLRAIGLKAWRIDIMTFIESMHDMSNPNQNLSYDSSNERKLFLSQVERKLGHLEREYQNLKETIVLLELALWKKRMTEYAEEEGGNMGELNQLLGGLGLQEVGVEAGGFRGQCRITSHSDIVIEHVLPYLVPVQRKYK